MVIMLLASVGLHPSIHSVVSTLCDCEQSKIAKGGGHKIGYFMQKK